MLTKIMFVVSYVPWESIAQNMFSEPCALEVSKESSNMSPKIHQNCSQILHTGSQNQS